MSNSLSDTYRLLFVGLGRRDIVQNGWRWCRHRRRHGRVAETAGTSRKSGTSSNGRAHGRDGRRRRDFGGSADRDAEADVGRRRRRRQDSRLRRGRSYRDAAHSFARQNFAAKIDWKCFYTIEQSKNRRIGTTSALDGVIGPGYWPVTLWLSNESFFLRD